MDYGFHPNMMHMNDEYDDEDAYHMYHQDEYCEEDDENEYGDEADDFLPFLAQAMQGHL